MGKLTNAFVVLDINGEDHTHPLFNDKDGKPKIFTSPGDVINTINDYNRDVEDRAAPLQRKAEWASKLGAKSHRDLDPFYDSIIVANVLTFSPE